MKFDTSLVKSLGKNERKEWILENIFNVLKDLQKHKVDLSMDDAKLMVAAVDELTFDDPWRSIADIVEMKRQSPKRIEYVKSFSWLVRKYCRHAIDKFCCCHCKKENPDLDIHHIRYRKDGVSVYFSEDLEKDICSCCRSCHNDFEAAKQDAINVHSLFKQPKKQNKVVLTESSNFSNDVLSLKNSFPKELSVLHTISSSSMNQSFNPTESEKRKLEIWHDIKRRLTGSPVGTRFKTRDVCGPVVQKVSDKYSAIFGALRACGVVYNGDAENKQSATNVVTKEFLESLKWGDETVCQFLKLTDKLKSDLETQNKQNKRRKKGVLVQTSSRFVELKPIEVAQFFNQQKISFNCLQDNYSKNNHLSSRCREKNKAKIKKQRNEEFVAFDLNSNVHSIIQTPVTCSNESSEPVDEKYVALAEKYFPYMTDEQKKKAAQKIFG